MLTHQSSEELGKKPTMKFHQSVQFQVVRLWQLSEEDAIEELGLQR